MDIGKPQRIITIEPIKDPIPQRERTPEREPERVPEREPVRTPEREPVPA